MYKYKSTITKVVALVVILMMIAGIIIPAVSAEEGLTNGENSKPGEGSDSQLETPEIKWTITGYPDSEGKGKWFKEEAFYHDTSPGLKYDKDVYYDNENKKEKERQFVKVTFAVDEGQLEFTGLGTLMANIKILAENSTMSMVDTEFLEDINAKDTGLDDPENPKPNEKQEFIDKYILKGAGTNRVTLYIPVKPLMPNTAYSVTIGANMVIINQEDKAPTGNDTYIWSFKTMGLPSLDGSGVLIQSVIEDYDEMEPIIIFGKYFDLDSLEIFFNDVRAYRIRPYDKIKVNTAEEGNKDSRDNENKEKDNKDKEQYIKVYLPGGRDRLEPGLYNITIKNSKNHSVELYGALSVVGRATREIPIEQNIYGTTTPYGSIVGSATMELIRLDHKDPLREYSLKKQLTQYILRSPIVETTSTINGMYILSIPYTEGIDESSFKLLKYNDILRGWVEEDFHIDNVNQKVIVTTLEGGIFVVVESKI